MANARVRIRVENVRLSMLYAFSPFKGDKESYCVHGLFDPKKALVVKRQDAAGKFTVATTLGDVLKEISKAEWSERGDATLKALVAADKVFLHKGDTKLDKKTGEPYPGYAGNYYISANNKNRPRIVIDNVEVTNPADPKAGKLFSGAYGNLIVDVWAQNNRNGQRINAGFAGVQYTAPGDPLGGGSPASVEDFEPLAGAGAGDQASTDDIPF